MISILHDKIYSRCTQALLDGWISVDDLENLDYLWRGYHNLGGNGTGEAIYKKVKKLPSFPPLSKEERNTNEQIKIGAWVRAIFLLLALVNQLLTSFNRSPLPIDSDQLSAILTAAFALWAGWKNNSFTEKAQQADEYLQSLKENS